MKTPPPFDLQKAMAGEPLVCRNPKAKATYGTYHPNASASSYPLHVWIEYEWRVDLYCFTDKGHFYSNSSFPQHYFDLFMAPKTETRTGWVNIYRCGTRPTSIGTYETEELAREMARLNPEGDLGTDSVTWEK